MEAESYKRSKPTTDFPGMVPNADPLDLGPVARLQINFDCAVPGKIRTRDGYVIQTTDQGQLDADAAANLGHVVSMVAYESQMNSDRDDVLVQMDNGRLVRLTGMRDYHRSV